MLKDWTYYDNAIAKKFVFENRDIAFRFISRVALYVEKINHHPYWSGVFNKVKIKLSTSDINDITLSEIDFVTEINNYV